MDPESHDSISSIESATGVIVVEVTQSRAEQEGKFGGKTFSSESSVSDIEGQKEWIAAHRFLLMVFHW